MEDRYDFLIVGSGLFGSVFANEAKLKGKKCLVIDKRSHIGGNVYTEEIEGINVHKYGAHIFHTSDKCLWDYVNDYAEFNNYINSPVANYKGKLYNLPFNMNTFYQLWGVTTPLQAIDKINEQRSKYLGIIEPRNLEEQALKLVGDDIYNILIKDYTKKQWGRDPKQIPGFIIKRLPLRFNFDNNYFNDKYQGIPVGGYTKLISGLLDDVDLRLGVDYFEDRYELDRICDHVIYTGKIDQYFEFCEGKLEYRSLHFESQILDVENYQGNAVMNYTSNDESYTRIIEHKHFEFGKQSKTYVTKEYPHEFSVDKEPYYPVNDGHNQKLYQRYYDMTKKIKNISFGGRLAEYKYYDMHHVVANAISLSKEIVSEG